MLLCEWCGKQTEEWNHILQYGGKQIDEAFAINGLCKKCHQMITRYHTKNEEEKNEVQRMKAFFQLNAINRMTPEDKRKYHKVSPPWIHQKEFLTKKLWRLSQL